MGPCHPYVGDGGISLGTVSPICGWHQNFKNGPCHPYMGDTNFMSLNDSNDNIISPQHKLVAKNHTFQPFSDFIKNIYRPYKSGCHPYVGDTVCAKAVFLIYMTLICSLKWGYLALTSRWTYIIIHFLKVYNIIWVEIFFWICGPGWHTMKFGAVQAD